MSTRWKFFAAAFALALTFLSPPSLKAEDVMENAGVAIGVSIGNVLFLPIKAISMTMGVFSAAILLRCHRECRPNQANLAGHNPGPLRDYA